LVNFTEKSVRSASSKIKEEEDEEQKTNFDLKEHYNNDFSSKEVRIRKFNTPAHGKVKNRAHI